MFQKVSKLVQKVFKMLRKLSKSSATAKTPSKSNNNQLIHSDSDESLSLAAISPTLKASPSLKRPSDKFIACTTPAP